MATKLQIEVDLDYTLQQPGPAILSVEAAGAEGQTIIDASIDLGQLEHFGRVPGEEGIGEKIVIRTANGIHCAYRAVVEVTRPDIVLTTLAAVDYDLLPGDALRYLLPSMYCEAERFVPFVGETFGELAGGAKVVAIRDWISQHLSYVSGTSTSETTATDTFLERRGVCRDYAHLMIAMCRAGSIPARIASGFAPAVEPPDFHAVAEVYLAGEWHSVDATGMSTPANFALIAVGRDALDVAFMTTTGAADMQTQSVRVTQIS
ncbi:MAG: transglutaminase [Paracoccus denitrificans]|nr:MAG: transglutaminase [Paracoccus denitrificans]PZO83439.1 MAG: transglutaminase [Paracoccus denitrificans]